MLVILVEEVGMGMENVSLKMGLFIKECGKDSRKELGF